MKNQLLYGILIGGGSVLGGIAGTTVLSQLERTAIAQAPPAQLSAPQAVVTDLLSIGDRFELVSKKVSPAVVYVEARKPSPEKSSSGGNKILEESGSGVIVRLEGRDGYYVLTNHHVIADARKDNIYITLADGKVLQPTRVWSHSESDVAILGVDNSLSLPSAPFGNSDKVQVGNWVLAIGSPFGLNQTVTHGILSARERGQINLGESIHIKDFLQTDAAINPGSSGGPLLNMNGEVIGINTAIASPNGSNSGVAFSIPINLFRRVAEQLIEKGSVSRVYIGVQLSHTFEAADALKVGLDRAQGALVEYVFPNSPAAHQGVKVGDVILEVNQTTIRNENQLINTISALPAGSAVDLTIWRDRQRMNAKVVVTENRPK